MAKDSPRLGSETFWNMAALALAGRLASCQSCVEFFYFQSKQNAVAFLDSCAAGGLVEKVSLLDLRGDLESISATGPTLQQQWYDQAIYISAPAYRKHNLDASRDRIEGTKNAVYNAFRLYFEKLKANNDAINAAYENAVNEGTLLRYAAIAKDRANVDLSHVAKLRLLQDGYKCSVKTKYANATPSETERLATESTVSYVMVYWNAKPSSTNEVCDRGEELEAFVREFLTDHRLLEKFWGELEPNRSMPPRSHFQMLRVISFLIRKRIQIIDDSGRLNKAKSFRDGIRAKLVEAQQRENNDTSYVEAVSEVIEDLDGYCSGLESSMPLVPTNPSQVRTEAR